MRSGQGVRCVVALAAGVIGGAATADMVGAVAVSYSVTATDFGGASVTVNVQDIYMLSDDPTDTILNVYDWNASQTGITFFQSFTGTGWMPTNLGGPFDTEALQTADSFVTIGGFGADARQIAGAGAGSGLDPNFGSNTTSEPGAGGADGGANAGWYNGNPPSLNGQTMTYDNGIQGVLIGRFANQGAFDLRGSTLWVTWNNGLGTPGNQAGFTIGGGGGLDDCNGNGIDDTVDIADGTSLDCNLNGNPDECDLAAGYSGDCNGNGVPDECDIDNGTELDCDGSGYPDSCEIGWGWVEDCDSNGIPDACDIAEGTAEDCNQNGYSDACEIDYGWTNDCDSNGVPDECDPDCDFNGYPDACEIEWGWWPDCDANGIPDNCDPDCDGDGTPDACEIADGLEFDYNDNGIPDSCEALRVPGDYDTIADAIQSAPEGSVVYVDAGAYEDAIVLDRAVAIVAPDGPGSTKLDGSKSLGPVVIVDNAPAGAVLAGFTVKAGDPSGDRPMGGGIVGVDSLATIADCVIVGNTGMEGGGLRFEGGSPTIVGCEIRHNLSYGVGGGVYAVGGELLVSDTAFAANISLEGTGHAVGSIDQSLASLEGCSIVDHTAAGSVVHSAASPGFVPVNFGVFDSIVADNAGTGIEGGHPNVEVASSLVENNGGDGIHLADGTWHILTGSVIRGNGGVGLAVSTGLDSIDTIADNTICGNAGGALDGLDPTDLLGAGNIVLDDRCPDLVVPDDADTIQLAIDVAIDGERIAVRPGDWDGFENDGRDLEVISTEGRDATTTAGLTATGAAPSTALVRGFTIGDVAGVGPVPAVSITDASPTIDACRITGGTDSGVQIAGGAPTIVDTIVDGNESPQFGGGIRLTAGTLTLDGVTVTGNSLPLIADSRGGGVFVERGAELVLIDSTVCDNARENLASFGTVSDQGGNDVCLAFDCDDNGVEDASDIGDLGRPDCNGNLVPDDCDIASGVSPDCDANGVPDECDIAGGIADCDGNGVIDSCETADGSAPDCNTNGIPDVCDLANGAPDLDLDGVPDECQTVLVFAVPDRFATITSAIDAAPDGSIIAIAPGSYTEAIDLGTKNLVLEGDPSDPSVTVLDGTGLATTMVTIAGGQDATTVIRGLTIAHGRAGTPEPGNPSIIRGAGMLVVDASPVVEDCVFTDNRTGYGAALYLSGSGAIVTGTAFTDNTATADGGGVMCVDSTASFTSCAFDGNVAGGNGGAVRFTGGDSTITECTMQGNDAFQGGGLFWYPSPGDATSLLVDRCEIVLNTATTSGGGVWARQTGAPVQLRETTVCDNEPDEIHGAFVDLGGGELCLCLGDFNDDGQVGPIDLGILLGAWGPCDGAPCPADIDLDGQVNSPDLGLLLGAWGVCP